MATEELTVTYSNNPDEMKVGATAATAHSTRTMGLAENTTFTTVRTDWQRPAERKLLELLRLPHGWDGHSGKPTNPVIAEYTYRLLEILMLRQGVPLPIITPLSYGGIIIEWHRKGWDIEIEIDAPASHHVFARELATGKENSYRLGLRLKELGTTIEKIKD